MTKFTKLLYLKSVVGNEIITVGQNTTHQFHYPTSSMPTLTYLLETYGLSLSYQTKQAKQVLKIRNMVPIFINPDITLFQLIPRRAPSQYRINANLIVWLNSNSICAPMSVNTTIIIDKSTSGLIKNWTDDKLVNKANKNNPNKIIYVIKIPINNMKK